MADKPVETPSHTDRMRELNAINAKVPHLLHAAGTGLACLTNTNLPAPLPSDTTSPPPIDPSLPGIEQRRILFRSASTTYMTILHQLKPALDDQVDALLAARIISANPPRRIEKGTKGGDGPRATNEGLGNMDVGWLNSRQDTVGRDMEKELVGEVKAVLEKMVGEGESVKKEEGNQHHDEMKVD